MPVSMLVEGNDDESIFTKDERRLDMNASRR